MRGSTLLVFNDAPEIYSRAYALKARFFHWLVKAIPREFLPYVPVTPVQMREFCQRTFDDGREYERKLMQPKGPANGSV